MADPQDHVTPDPRPARRVRDPELLRQLHAQPPHLRRCALDPGHTERTTLHHIHKHPRDDVPANLLWLCGHGTSGCHGRVEAHDLVTMVALQTHLLFQRQDFLRYLQAKLGHDPAHAWVMALSQSKIGT